MKLNEEQRQVILTGVLSDGCLYAKNGNAIYISNSKNYEYLQYKKTLLGDLCTSSIRESINGGYKKDVIYTLITKSHPEITEIMLDSLENNVNKLTELGLALWFYDDGSFHKKKHFYNLCTHSFTEEQHDDILIPYFSSLGVIPQKRIERKKDGRVFNYLSFNKLSGAEYFMKLLNKYPVASYSYKTLTPETIEKIMSECKIKPQIRY